MQRLPTIHATHIEKPAKTFLVQFKHTRYKPEGFPFSFPEEIVRRKVLAETGEGALSITKFHHYVFGSEFKLLGAWNEKTETMV